MLTITTLYTLILSVLMLVLWMNVTRTRAGNHISIGHGDDVTLHERVRMHGNFMEWVPMTVALIALAELNGVSSLWLHACGIAAVIGRVAHPFGLKADNPAHPLRIVGNMGNLLAVLALVFLIVLRVLVP